MTTIDSSSSSALTTLASSYTSTESEDQAMEDYLGMEDFLTMLVAQLENQDPLNPMEGSDFSAQLAQFSTLEQLIYINESVQDLVETVAENDETDVNDYLGKEVTGTANAIEVASGSTTSGSYQLTEAADVMVTIYNSDGDLVTTLDQGQQSTGSYGVYWDGTDSGGDTVEDGTYTFDVLANTGSGYDSISTTVTGTVESIVYQNGTPYLVVDGVALNPAGIVSVSQSSTSSETDTGSSALTTLDYLGMDISYSDTLFAVESSSVSGDGSIAFELSDQEDVLVQIFDASGNEINRLAIAADETVAEDNLVVWDGTDSSGDTVTDGVYSYTVTTDSGEIDTGDSGEVTGIKTIAGTQYLVAGDNGDIVSLSNITAVN